VRARRPRSVARSARGLRALALAAALWAAAGCRGGVRGAGRPAEVVPPAVVLPPAADAGADADASPRQDVQGLPSFGRVDDGLCRSGQPDDEGYRTAKALGVRTVVDLRGSKVGPAATAAAGLDLVVVRTGAKRVSEADLVAFLRVATDPARRPVLVHCASGHDRTGAMVAAYRRVVCGWSAEAALREMRRFGAAPWYRNLVKLIERLDPDAVRARLASPDGREAGGPRPPAAPAPGEAAPAPDDDEDDDPRPGTSPTPPTR
jgi:tyrosine-protein phosphatase SIW14